MKFRQRTALLLALLVFIFLLAGCGNNSAGQQPPPPSPPQENGQEQPGDEPLPAAYRDGSYEGVGQGYAGDIILEVTIAGGTLTNIEIVDEQETASIGGVAFPELVEMAKEAQGADIDVITGATKTTEGFSEALRDALLQAAE